VKRSGRVRRPPLPPLPPPPPPPPADRRPASRAPRRHVRADKLDVLDPSRVPELRAPNVGDVRVVAKLRRFLHHGSAEAV